MNFCGPADTDLPIDPNSPTPVNNTPVPRPSARDLTPLVGVVSNRSGIAPAHFLPFQAYAAKTDCVIGIRMVESASTGLVQAGYPTKNFLVKGKSASWGPQAGLICVNQGFSKLEGRDAARIEKYEALVRHCVSQGHASAGPLVLPRERLDALQDLLCRQARDQADGNQAYGNQACNKQTPGLGKRQDAPAFAITDAPNGDLVIDARGPSGTSYRFEGRLTAPLQYRIDYEGKPLQVLFPAVPKLGGEQALPTSPYRPLPLTADYDLLLVGPAMASLGADDNLPLHEVHPARAIELYSHYSRASRKDVIATSGVNPYYQKSFFDKEDKLLGNVSRRIAHMIPEINRHVVGPDAPWVVHHNADSGSPATDPASNYPATFFLPRKIGRFDEICIVEDSRTLSELITSAKAAGYHMPVNPAWSGEPGLDRNSVYRPSFRRARQKLAVNLPPRHRA